MIDFITIVLLAVMIVWVVSTGPHASPADSFTAFRRSLKQRALNRAEEQLAKHEYASVYWDNARTVRDTISWSMGEKQVYHGGKVQMLKVRISRLHRELGLT